MTLAYINKTRKAQGARCLMEVPKYNMFYGSPLDFYFKMG